MTRAEFLGRLRRALRGAPAGEIDDVVADYSAHFADGIAAGRSEEEVAEALGDPARLARELRAEAGLRRWETQRTPGALLGAIVSLGGLLALDILVLLPILITFGVIGFVLSIILFAIGVAGFGLMLSGMLHWAGPSAAALARTLGGIGLVGASVGFGALLWMVLELSVKLLGGYARLHYRALKPGSRTA